MVIWEYDHPDLKVAWTVATESEEKARAVFEAYWYRTGTSEKLNSFFDGQIARVGEGRAWTEEQIKGIRAFHEGSTS